jgi:predicted DNA-binding antitoxin AbrB/MazE fold protein
MMKQIEAVYEEGVLRPLEPLELEEHQRVTIIISENCDALDDLEDAAFRAWCAQQAGDDVPNIEEVRQSLSSIQGSMVDVIRAERDAR